MSQVTLAARTSMRRDEIQELEKGGAPVSVATLLKLSGALEIPSGALLGGMAWLPDEGCFELGEGERDA